MLTEPTTSHSVDEQLPEDGDDSRLIGCAGAGIGLLLTGRTDGVEGMPDA